MTSDHGPVSSFCNRENVGRHVAHLGSSVALKDVRGVDVQLLPWVDSNENWSGVSLKINESNLSVKRMNVFTVRE